MDILKPSQEEEESSDDDSLIIIDNKMKRNKVVSLETESETDSPSPITNVNLGGMKKRSRILRESVESLVELKPNERRKVPPKVLKRVRTRSKKTVKKYSSDVNSSDIKLSLKPKFQPKEKERRKKKTIEGPELISPLRFEKQSRQSSRTRLDY